MMLKLQEKAAFLSKLKKYYKHLKKVVDSKIHLCYSK